MRGSSKHWDREHGHANCCVSAYLLAGYLDRLVYSIARADDIMTSFFQKASQRLFILWKPKIGGRTAEAWQWL